METGYRLESVTGARPICYVSKTIKYVDETSDWLTDSMTLQTPHLEGFKARRTWENQSESNELCWGPSEVDHKQSSLANFIAFQMQSNFEWKYVYSAAAVLGVQCQI